MSSRSDAEEALFKEIATLTEKIGSGGLQSPGKARALRDLALAFRYVAGGPQPGAAGDA